MIEVEVLQNRGNNSVVVMYEQESVVHCVVVPKSIIDDGKASVAELECGVPCGIQWEEKISLNIKPDLGKVLRRKGLFTPEDVLNNQKAAFSAIQSAYGFNLKDLLNLSQKMVRSNE